MKTEFGLFATHKIGLKKIIKIEEFCLWNNFLLAKYPID